MFQANKQKENTPATAASSAESKTIDLSDQQQRNLIQASKKGVPNLTTVKTTKNLVLKQS